MNTNTPFNLSVVIGLIIIGLLVIFFVQYKKGKYKPNYRLFFILGTTWVPIGVVLYITTGNFGFFIMGLIFLILGLVNKNKWEEPDPATTQQKKIVIGVLVIGLLVLGALLFRYFK